MNPIASCIYNRHSTVSHVHYTRQEGSKMCCQEQTNILAERAQQSPTCISCAYTQWYVTPQSHMHKMYHQHQTRGKLGFKGQYMNDSLDNQRTDAIHWLFSWKLIFLHEIIYLDFLFVKKIEPNSVVLSYYVGIYYIYIQ